MARKSQFTETVLRDANQSLMATRLPFADYGGNPVRLWIRPATTPSSAGAARPSTAACGTWTRIPGSACESFRKAMPNTKLQMLLRGQNLLGYKHYHDDVVEKFVELSIKNGIDVLRIFDALNDFRNIRTALEATKKYATKNTDGFRLHLLHPVPRAHPGQVRRDVQGAAEHGLRYHLPEGYGRYHEPQRG